MFVMAGDNEWYLQMFISDIHRDIAMHDLGTFEPFVFTFDFFLKNFGGLPDHLKGFTLDRLPQQWEAFAGRDIEHDRKDFRLR